MYIVKKWFGIFIVNEKNEIIDYMLYPKNDDEIYKKLKSIDRNEFLKSENLMGLKIPEKIEIKDIDIAPENYGFNTKLLHNAIMKYWDEKICKQPVDKEMYIIYAINLLREIEKSINLFTERFFDICNNVLPENKINKNLIEDIFENNYIDEDTFKLLQPIAKYIIFLKNSKQDIEKYIESEMNLFAPNLSYLLGSVIGAELISKAKGLNRLATTHASKIQVLGAEKSLFKSTKTPKYGIIYKHPLIYKSKKEVRGRIARKLANIIAISARADMFTKRFIADKLKSKLIEKEL